LKNNRQCFAFVITLSTVTTASKKSNHTRTLRPVPTQNGYNESATLRSAVMSKVRTEMQS